MSDDVADADERLPAAVLTRMFRLGDAHLPQARHGEYYREVAHQFEALLGARHDALSIESLPTSC